MQQNSRGPLQNHPFSTGVRGAHSNQPIWLPAEWSGCSSVARIVLIAKQKPKPAARIPVQAASHS
jgi:hypothetical protein